jgi:nicotinamide-nucleotide amidase
LHIEHEGRHVYVLPGVPREMKSIFEGAVMASLKRLPKDEVTKTRVIRTTGLQESEIAANLGPIVPELDVKLGYLPRVEGVDLRLTASGPDQPSVTGVLDAAAGKVVPLLGDRVYSTDGEDLGLVVGNMLMQTGTSIAVAESCTGGLIGHLLTQVPGISACLERVVVAYSNKAKIDSLSVGGNLIEEHGAVSREVAAAMAEGVRDIAGTDLGISTTGIAGPTGGTDAKPVGLVYIGLADESACTVSENRFAGSRDAVKARAAIRALDLVRGRLTRR